MITDLAAPTASLATAVAWTQQLILGSLGTSVALLAVASIGFMLLQGRLAVVAGARVIVGCFVLFGAPLIARSLIVVVRGDRSPGLVQIPQPPQPIPVPLKPPQFDPYAGASVPR